MGGGKESGSGGKTPVKELGEMDSRGSNVGWESGGKGSRARNSKVCGGSGSPERDGSVLRKGSVVGINAAVAVDEKRKKNVGEVFCGKQEGEQEREREQLSRSSKGKMVREDDSDWEDGRSNVDPTTSNGIDLDENVIPVNEFVSRRSSKGMIVRQEDSDWEDERSNGDGMTSNEIDLNDIVIPLNEFVSRRSSKGMIVREEDSDWEDGRINGDGTTSNEMDLDENLIPLNVLLSRRSSKVKIVREEDSDWEDGRSNGDGTTSNEMDLDENVIPLNELLSRISGKKRSKRRFKRRLLNGPSPEKGSGVGVDRNEKGDSQRSRRKVLLEENNGKTEVSHGQQSKASSKRKLLPEEDPDWFPRRENLYGVHNRNSKCYVEGDDDVNSLTVLALPVFTSEQKQEEKEVEQHSLKKDVVHVRRPKVQENKKKEHFLNRVIGVHDRRPKVQENKKKEHFLKRVIGVHVRRPKVQENKKKQHFLNRGGHVRRPAVQENKKKEHSLNRLIGMHVPRPVVQGLPARGGQWNSGGVIAPNGKTCKPQSLEDDGVDSVSKHNVQARRLKLTEGDGKRNSGGIIVSKRKTSKHQSLKNDGLASVSKHNVQVCRHKSLEDAGKWNSGGMISNRRTSKHHSLKNDGVPSVSKSIVPACRYQSPEDDGKWNSGGMIVSNRKTSKHRSLEDDGKWNSGGMILSNRKTSKHQSLEDDGKWNSGGMIVSNKKTSEHHSLKDGVARVSKPIVQALAAPYDPNKVLSSSARLSLSSSKGVSTQINVSGCADKSLSMVVVASPQHNSEHNEDDWVSSPSEDACSTRVSNPELENNPELEKADIDSPHDAKLCEMKRSVRTGRFRASHGKEFHKQNGVCEVITEEIVQRDKVTLSKKLNAGKEVHEVTDTEKLDDKWKLFCEDECLNHVTKCLEGCGVVMKKNEQDSNDEVHQDRECQGVRRSNRLNGRHVPVDCELDMVIFDCDFDVDSFNDDDFVKPGKSPHNPDLRDKENEERSPKPERAKLREVCQVMASCVTDGNSKNAEFRKSVDNTVQKFSPSVLKTTECLSSQLNYGSEIMTYGVSEVVTSSLEDERGHSGIEDACLSSETIVSDRSSSVVVKKGHTTETDMDQDGPSAERGSMQLNERHVPVDGEIDAGAMELGDSMYSSNFVIARGTKQNTLSQADRFEQELPKTGDLLLKPSTEELDLRYSGIEKQLEGDLSPCKDNSVVEPTTTCDLSPGKDNNVVEPTTTCDLLLKHSTEKLDLQYLETEKQMESDIAASKDNNVVEIFNETQTSVSKNCTTLPEKNCEQSPRKEKFLSSKRRSVGGGRGSTAKKKRKRRGACSLTVRRTRKANSGEDASYETKVNILSWLIDSGAVVEHEKVLYKVKTSQGKMLKGRVTRGGIRCNCCKKVLSLLEFEAHAGSDLKNPWINTCLSSGKSLIQCQIEAWEKEKKEKKIGFRMVEVGDTDPGDDTCAVCCDGGHLLCCDSCPSTFHPECLMLKSLPEGNWYCSYCTCTFCTLVDRGQDNKQTMNLLICNQCSCKFHIDCVCDNNMEKTCSKSVAYCGTNCEKVHSYLSKILGIRNPIEGSFAWTLLRRVDEGTGGSWEDQMQSYITECNVKLSMALVVLYECFVPLVDYRTGLDMISQAVYSCGSNFNRLNYGGFYTVILEKDEEIISVATLRLHGTRVAEMPFIGTRPIYRRQGMCRRLLRAIEEMLSSMHVEKLIIPAIPDMMETWMTSFSFQHLEASHKEEIRSLNMVLFSETSLLQKPICSKSTSIANDGNQIDMGNGMEMSLLPQRCPDAPMNDVNISNYCSS